MTDEKDDMLDDLFAVARMQTPQPGDALMARVLADAAGAPAPQRVVDHPGLWAQLCNALGGWPAVGGLAAATVAGIWVGVAPPSSIENLATSVIGDTMTVSLFTVDAMYDVGDFADG
ncbi:hypothetical protein [Yoonia sp.]|uniref:hypothetical protein n=1 Tax=Yoonia sp. TaxID=2212373 RepID=UPI003F6B6AA2